MQAVKKRDTLQQYGRIQRADNRFIEWREVQCVKLLAVQCGLRFSRTLRARYGLGLGIF